MLLNRETKADTNTGCKIAPVHRQNSSAMSVSRAGHNSVELFFAPRTACRLSFSGGAAIGPKIAFFFVTFFLAKQKESKIMRAGNKEL